MQGFEDRPLEETIARVREGARLWIFVHVPKTAGSSLTQALVAHAQPYRNIHVDDDRDAGLPHLQRIALAADRFLDEARTTPFRTCSGHLQARDHRRIADAVEGSRLVTMLRHPVDRVISDYRYSRTPAHPEWREAIERFPTIEDYVESPDGRNKIWRFLAADQRAPLERTIRQIEADFAFVGLAEMYPMSFDLLMRMIAGRHLAPGPRMRKTEATADNRVADDAALRQRIAALNRKDLAIYRHFRAKLWAKRQEWLTLRSAGSGGGLAAGGE